MKLYILIGVLSAVTVMASPGASKLDRSFVEVTVTPTNSNEPTGTMHIACIECPCDGFSGDCSCVENGCCCIPPTGWRAGPAATGV